MIAGSPKNRPRGKSAPLIGEGKSLNGDHCFVRIRGDAEQLDMPRCNNSSSENTELFRFDAYHYLDFHRDQCREDRRFLPSRSQRHDPSRSCKVRECRSQPRTLHATIFAVISSGLTQAKFRNSQAAHRCRPLHLPSERQTSPYLHVQHSQGPQACHYEHRLGNRFEAAAQL